MKKFICVFFYYVYELTTTQADHQFFCCENEVLAYCKNPCLPTCQEPYKLPCPTFACMPGCVCKPGTIRDEVSGKCVIPEYCPADHQIVCCENEVLANCKNPCLPTCQEPYKLPCPTFACMPGCVCKPGTIRDEVSGKCVSPEYCPAVCPKNEEPNECRNRCEPTCQNLKFDFQCVFQNKRCTCKPGLLRDLHSGKCVIPEHCPQECGINEEWSSCTNPVCRKTCQSPFRKLVMCPQVCVPGCQCIEGFVWDEYFNKCIPEGQCPTVCRENEEWKNCSDILCRKTCHTPKPEYCLEICTPGCSCKAGFIWDEQRKKCVSKQECSKLCDKNQEWRECSDLNCRETCQKPKPKICTKMCIHGCSCKKGYIWDEHYKSCVPIGSCSKVCGENAEWCEFVPTDITTCQSLLKPQCSSSPSFVALKPGCMCKEGFIWDEFTQKCIRLEDCPGFTTTNPTLITTTQPTTITAATRTTTAQSTITAAATTTSATFEPTTTTAGTTTT